MVRLYEQHQLADGEFWLLDVFRQEDLSSPDSTIPRPRWIGAGCARPQGGQLNLGR